jgi:kynureninase
MTCASSELDRSNPLALFHSEFCRPGNKIYLDGNSLGLLPSKAVEIVGQRIREWQEHAVEGWTACAWFDLAERLAAGLANLLGAAPDEFIFTGSTTVNLHQLLATYYQPNPNKSLIVIEAAAFPSDRYAVESHLRLRGLDPITALRVVPNTDRGLLDPQAILDAIDDAVAFAVLPTVAYSSGQLLPIPAINQKAKSRGVRIAWDCSHSAGAIDHDFTAQGVELAFGCSYKFLNGGPGAVGFLFRSRHLPRFHPGLAGWWGNEKTTQFEMAQTFRPAAGAGALQISTPSLLSLAPLEASLEILQRAGMNRIRSVSLALTRFLMDALEKRSGGFRIVTPKFAEERGGHVALQHPLARPIAKLLRERFGVIGDFRPPDTLRLAPVALYNSFAELEQTVQFLCEAEALAPSLIEPSRDVIT